jgi:hypothetical protein
MSVRDSACVQVMKCKNHSDRALDLQRRRQEVGARPKDVAERPALHNWIHDRQGVVRELLVSVKPVEGQEAQVQQLKIYSHPPQEFCPILNVIVLISAPNQVEVC